MCTHEHSHTLYVQRHIYTLKQHRDSAKHLSLDDDQRQLLWTGIFVLLSLIKAALIRPTRLAVVDGTH